MPCRALTAIERQDSVSFGGGGGSHQAHERAALTCDPACRSACPSGERLQRPEREGTAGVGVWAREAGADVLSWKELGVAGPRAGRRVVMVRVSEGSGSLHRHTWREAAGVDPGGHSRGTDGGALEKARRLHMGAEGAGRMASRSVG